MRQHLAHLSPVARVTVTSISAPSPPAGTKSSCETMNSIGRSSLTDCSRFAASPRAKCYVCAERVADGLGLAFRFQRAIHFVANLNQTLPSTHQRRVDECFHVSDARELRHVNRRFTLARKMLP